MNKIGYDQTKYRNNHLELIPKTFNSLNLKELSIKNINNTSLVKNVDDINHLISRKIKLKKLIINNKTTNRKESYPTKRMKKVNNCISLRANRSCGEIANEMAKINMDYYLNGDIEQNKDKKRVIMNIDKILDNKEKNNYFKDKENIYKNIKNIKIKNSKKIKKAYSQDNINRENIYNSESNEKDDNNKIQFNIDNICFNNPFNSCNAIYQNKVIYQDIINKYNKSMISEYEKSINNLNPIIKQKKTNSQQKIRILPYISRNIINLRQKEPINNKYNLLYKFNNNRRSNLSRLIGNIADELKITQALDRKSKHYLLKNTIQFPTNGYPESRIDFSLSQEREKYIIYGGSNSSRNANLWEFNPEKRCWNIIQEEGIKNESRYGHSAALRNRNLYIFGGVFLIRKIFGDVEVFNLDTKKWYYPKLLTSNKLSLRRNHIGCTIGNQMFIYGGIDEFDEYLNDCYILNYRPLQWNIPIIEKKVRMPYLAYHSCCLVIPQDIRENPNFSIYNFPSNNKLSHIKEKGLYIFGGQVSKNGILNKNIYVLKVGQKPLQWILLKTKGISPSKRYATSMSYYESGNFLIIHGGRNNSGSSNYVLNDTFILDLYTLNWMKIEYYDNQREIPPRFFHQSFVYDNCLFVFGGTNGLNYLGSEFFILELDSNERCLRERDEMQFLKIFNINITENKDNNNNNNNILQNTSIPPSNLVNDSNNINNINKTVKMTTYS